MRRESTEMTNRGDRGRTDSGSRMQASKRSKLRRLTLEPLELRQLLATAPVPIVSNQAAISTASSVTNDSSPFVAIDPVNSQKMVSVWTDRNTGSGSTVITAEAAYSNDGGQTWNSINLPGFSVDPTSTASPPALLTYAVGSGVGFDQNQNFYIGVLQGNSGNTGGFAYSNKFSFTGNTPRTTSTDNMIYEWNQSTDSSAPSVVNFDLDVDDNVKTFTDPTTGARQTDNAAGDVYAAMTFDTPDATIPYSIILAGSTNGTSWTSSFVELGAGASAADPVVTDPRISISQGKPGATDGGLVTVAWDTVDALPDDTYGPADAILVAAVQPTVSQGTISFTGSVTDVATTYVVGALTSQGAATYPLGSTDSVIGIGPSVDIATDTTLGSYSPYQGRIYLTFTGIIPQAEETNTADNTDIYLTFSDDDGQTWSPPTVVNDDNGVTDGYSDSSTAADQQAGTSLYLSGRPQYDGSVAVDKSTGTVAVSWLDARNSAADSTYSDYLTASIDGGQSFAPDTYADTPNTATDAITGLPVTIGPYGGNQSSNNPSAETSISFGQHQAVAIANGVIIPVWATTLDDAEGEIGTTTGAQLSIESAQATVPTGARVVSSTMGPVAAVTDPTETMTINDDNFASDNTEELDGFFVTFDRPVSVASFTASNVQVFYNTPSALTDTPVSVGTPEPIISGGTVVDDYNAYLAAEDAPATPLSTADSALEATTFFVPFSTPQSNVGTYSYEIGPTIKDRIGSAGNEMDQNPGETLGAFNNVYSVPGPATTSATPLAAPYDTSTLPLIIPGPHLVSTFVPDPKSSTQLSSGTDNLVLNNTVSYLDVQFDRDINPSSFTASQVLQLTGPNGVVNATFVVAPETNPAYMAADENGTTKVRTFRISFLSPTTGLPLALSVSGTYSIVLGTGITSTSGYAVDNNENAGLDLLFDRTTTGDTSTTTTYNGSAATITQGTKVGATITPSTTTSTITINDSYLIQNLTLALNITYPHDPDLTVTLTGPDGESVQLFGGIGNVGPISTQKNFTNTRFSDTATTEITTAAPPYTGLYYNQFAPFLTGNYQVNGVWTLTITNTGTTAASTGTLTAWSLSITKANVLDTGLGEPIADRSSASFRIFTMDPTNTISSNNWTEVGPASNNNNGETNENAGSVTAIAVDPSDPSGNTAYVGGASGGIWMTTDLLTTAAQGPTYVPLTDTGPVDGLNIGSIAIFGRNNDPSQSVIIAGTGDGDLLNSNNGRHDASNAPNSTDSTTSTSAGVGFLISYDGGASWTVLDSATNFTSAGAEIPEASRDKTFIGATVFKVIADPKLSPSGQIIFYAAVSDATNPSVGGVWRSIDSGHTWQQVIAGQATDVIFDANSGTVSTNNPTGNLRVIDAAFSSATSSGGPGVYVTPNQGQTWSDLVGGVGDPFLIESTTNAAVPVDNLTSNPGSAGTGGRIVLARPALTGDPTLDIAYETWIYAAVSNPDGSFNGLYMTKDNGQNWTEVQLPSDPNGSLIPTNNISDTDYNPFGNQGGYDISLAVDPNDPNVVYLGGNSDNPGTSAGNQPVPLIRIDTTLLADPYFLASDSQREGGAQLQATTDPVSEVHNDFNPFLDTPDPLFNPTINLVRAPDTPFTVNTTIKVSGAGAFTNSGSGATYTPFSEFLDYAVGFTPQQAVNIHTLVTIPDPLTGKARLLVGTDQGIYTAVDNDGSLLTTIGTQTIPTGSLNGNLQINQFYSAAAQPSTQTGDSSTTPSNTTAGALFYGESQDNGLLTSDPNLLTDGDLEYGGLIGSGTDVATDQTGSGTSYSSNWPGSNSLATEPTDFYQVNPAGTGDVSRTFGLFQSPTDPEWPQFASYNFAVNPIDGDEMMIASATGQLFGTENQGEIWYVLANPATDGFDGTPLPAIAYGAPDPNGPGLQGALNNYLLVGSKGGNIYVTFTGGGTTNGSNAWTNISSGLDGSPVEQIITDPTRGTHDAYAVTTTGVFYNADTSAAGTTWVNITGSLFSLTTTPFGDSNLTQPALLPASLDAIAADWRYVIPDNPADPSGPTHPMLYVAGNGGVFRSTDNGTTWSLFPNQTSLATLVTDGLLPADAALPQGGMPSTNITSLSTALGNIDPTTGHPDVSTGPNILLASTYGRGLYALRLAPVIFEDGTNDVSLSSTLPTPNGSDTGKYNNDGITNDTTPYFNGLSEQTAFSNEVAISVYLTTPTNAYPNASVTNPVLVGGYDPTTGVLSSSFDAAETDAFGRFNIQATSPLANVGFNGSVTVELIATDASGTQGTPVTFTFTLLTNPPPTPIAPVLDPVSDSGFSSGDDYTNVTDPLIDVVPTEANSEILLFREQVSSPNAGYTVISGLQQVATYLVPQGASTTTAIGVEDPGVLTNGYYIYTAEIEDIAGNKSGMSPNSAIITIDTTPPATPKAPILDPASDSGTKGDDITNVTDPTFDVPSPTEGAPTRTYLYRNTTNNSATATLVASEIGNANLMDPGVPAAGTYYYFLKQIDLAGNASAFSAGTKVQIITSIPGAIPTIYLDPSTDSGVVGDGITNITPLKFDGTTPLATTLPLTLEILNATTGQSVSQAAPGTGTYQQVTFTPSTPNGTYTFYAEVIDTAGNISKSAPYTVVVNKATLTTPTLYVLPSDVVPANGVGTSSTKTVVRKPHLVGVTTPGATVTIYTVNGTAHVVQATTTASSVASGGNPAGYFSAQLPYSLTDGTIQLYATANDAAGNTSSASTALTLQVFSVAGDYNGDGAADIGVFRPSTDVWYIKNSGGGAQTIQAYGQIGTDVPVPGDYDGDGKTDIAVFRSTTDQWFIDQSTLGQTVISFGYIGHDIPVPAPYDASGYTDVAVYRPSTAQWFILHNTSSGLSSPTQTTVTFGETGVDQPVPADYDGVGYDQIAVYRPTNGNWYVRNASTFATEVVVNLGYQPGDVPVPGDYDGLGHAEEAIYRPSTGQFIIYDSKTNSIHSITVGTPNSVPVPEDYTGSGKTDPAVYNPSTAQWTYINPTTNMPVVVSYGAIKTDVALPGTIQYRFSSITGGVPSGISAFGVAGGSSASGSSSGGSSSSGGASSGSGSTSHAVTVGASTPTGGAATGKTNARPTTTTAPITFTAEQITLAVEWAVEEAKDVQKLVKAYDLALERVGRMHRSRVQI